MHQELQYGRPALREPIAIQLERIVSTCAWLAKRANTVCKAPPRRPCALQVPTRPQSQLRPNPLASGVPPARTAPPPGWLSQQTAVRASTPQIQAQPPKLGASLVPPAHTVQKHHLNTLCALRGRSVAQAPRAARPARWASIVRLGWRFRVQRVPTTLRPVRLP